MSLIYRIVYCLMCVMHGVYALSKNEAINRCEIALKDLKNKEQHMASSDIIRSIYSLVLKDEEKTLSSLKQAATPDEMAQKYNYFQQGIQSITWLLDHFGNRGDTQRKGNALSTPAGFFGAAQSVAVLPPQTTAASLSSPTPPPLATENETNQGAKHRKRGIKNKSLHATKYRGASKLSKAKRTSYTHRK